jgi:hypothetical protein
MLVIPFSRNVRTANLTVTVGTILFDESSKVRKKKNTHTQKHTHTHRGYLLVFLGNNIHHQQTLFSRFLFVLIDCLFI